MNELLQKHGCSNVFSLPEGLKELMSDITREVLRDQPPKIYDYIANYLSALLITREHGILAVKILNDLCDCRPTVSEHLLEIGLRKDQADEIAQVIKDEIENFEPVDGKEKLKETQVIKKILNKNPLDEVMSAKVCQITRNAYRDYWYRKKMLQQNLKVEPDEPWEIAAQNTLELYKSTKPSFDELNRATQRIQAAYRGYHVRKKMLKHLKPKPHGPKMELPGPPIDIAASREIDLGPLVKIQVKEEQVMTMFETEGAKLGLHYDPTKTLTHVEDLEQFHNDESSCTSSSDAGKSSHKSKHVSHSRADSFVQEVLGFGDNKNDFSNKVTPGTSVRASVATISKPHRGHSVSSDHSATFPNKTISFSDMPPEVIPDIIADDDDEIQEDIPDSHTEGDGGSTRSASSGAETAEMSDFDEVDEAINITHDL